MLTFLALSCRRTALLATILPGGSAAPGVRDSTSQAPAVDRNCVDSIELGRNASIAASIEVASPQAPSVDTPKRPGSQLEGMDSEMTWPTPTIITEETVYQASTKTFDFDFLNDNRPDSLNNNKEHSDDVADLSDMSSQYMFDTLHWDFGSGDWPGLASSSTTVKTDSPSILAELYQCTCPRKSPPVVIILATSDTCE